MSGGAGTPEAEEPKPPHLFFPTAEVILLALAFWAGIGMLRDFDVWWHLAAGRDMAATWTIPRIDTWSFTASGRQWFAHEWLSEVILYGLYQAGGVNALLVWKSAMGLLALLALSRVYRSADRSSGLAHLAGLVAAIVCVHYHLLERPHMFTNCLLAVQVMLLEAHRRGERDRLGWLVPLYLLWANLHGGVVAGLVTFGLYGAGALTEWLLGDSGARRRSRRLAAVGAACLLVSLANPRGPELLVYPLQYAGHGTLAQDITEWTSPDFREFKPMEGMLLALLVLGCCARFGATATEALLVLAGLHLFLQSKRNIVFIALFVLPVAVDRLGRLVEGTGAAWRIARLRQGGGALLAAAVLVIALFVVAWQPPRVTPAYYPEGAVAYLKANPHAEPMLNEFVYGGYFVWNLAPTYRVFIDSRTDLFFNNDVFAEYLAVFKLAAGWKAVLDKYRIGLAVFERGHPLETVMDASGEWDEVWHDDLTTIRVRRKERGPR